MSPSVLQVSDYVSGMPTPTPTHHPPPPSPSCIYVLPTAAHINVCGLSNILFLISYFVFLVTPFKCKGLFCNYVGSHPGT